MCEEVIVAIPGGGSSLVFRGPRLKTGCDLGDALTGLNTVTGEACWGGYGRHTMRSQAELAIVKPTHIFILLPFPQPAVIHHGHVSHMHTDAPSCLPCPAQAA